MKQARWLISGYVLSVISAFLVVRFYDREAKPAVDNPERTPPVTTVAEEDRHLSAMRQAGHALLAFLLPQPSKPDEVTLAPRGASGGRMPMLADGQPEEVRVIVGQVQGRVSRWR